MSDSLNTPNPMPTLMNHEKVLQVEMMLTRIISERNELILMLTNSTKSQSAQIKQLEEVIEELKGKKE